RHLDAADYSPSQLAATLAGSSRPANATMTETGIRIPRIHARPPMISGSKVIRSNRISPSPRRCHNLLRPTPYLTLTYASAREAPGHLSRLLQYSSKTVEDS